MSVIFASSSLAALNGLLIAVLLSFVVTFLQSQALSDYKKDINYSHNKLLDSSKHHCK